MKGKLWYLTSVFGKFTLSLPSNLSYFKLKSCIMKGDFSCTIPSELFFPDTCVRTSSQLRKWLVLPGATVKSFDDLKRSFCISHRSKNLGSELFTPSDALGQLVGTGTLSCVPVKWQADSSYLQADWCLHSRQWLVLFIWQAESPLSVSWPVCSDKQPCFVSLQFSKS